MKNTYYYIASFKYSIAILSLLFVLLNHNTIAQEYKKVNIQHVFSQKSGEELTPDNKDVLMSPNKIAIDFEDNKLLFSFKDKNVKMGIIKREAFSLSNSSGYVIFAFHNGQEKTFKYYSQLGNTYFSCIMNEKKYVYEILE